MFRNCITGIDLRKARKAANLTQVDFAQQAEIGRHAVSYWECKAVVPLRGWAVQRMVAVLGADRLKVYPASNARAGGWGDSVLRAERQATDARIEAQLAAMLHCEAEAAKRLRVICGAKTRKGGQCRNKSEPGKARCKFHGGKSTGAKTPEGIARISEAQRRRWARYHETRQVQPQVIEEFAVLT